MSQFIPSSPVAPARWPSLVQSVGGEAAIRAFTEANSGEGHPNRWEAGVEFMPGALCEMVNFTPQDSTPCAADVAFNDTETQVETVTSIPLYYPAVMTRSTFCSIDETREQAKARLSANLSFQLEKELWLGGVHTSLGLEGQWLEADATPIGGGSITLIAALASLQQAWATCAAGARGMIHIAPKIASLWATTGAIRRESGMLLDIFDNIVVAGSGYPNDGTAYVTAVVDVHLSEVVVMDTINHTDNTEMAVAYRAGLVKYEPCCVLSVDIDESICG
jgi:hypothetical protein